MSYVEYALLLFSMNLKRCIEYIALLSTWVTYIVVSVLVADKIVGATINFLYHMFMGTITTSMLVSYAYIVIVAFRDILKVPKVRQAVKRAMIALAFYSMILICVVSFICLAMPSGHIEIEPSQVRTPTSNLTNNNFFFYSIFKVNVYTPDHCDVDSVVLDDVSYPVYNNEYFLLSLNSSTDCGKTFHCNTITCNRGHFWSDISLPCNDIISSLNCSQITPNNLKNLQESYMSEGMMTIFVLLFILSMLPPVIYIIVWHKNLKKKLSAINFRPYSHYANHYPEWPIYSNSGYNGTKITETETETEYLPPTGSYKENPIMLNI